jgi:hypothetical protein
MAQHVSPWAVAKVFDGCFKAAVVPGRSPLGQLLLKSSHEVAHQGVLGSLHRSRAVAWVTSGKKEMSKIVRKCTTCRCMKPEFNGEMAGAPGVELLTPAPVFSYTSVDIFGPILTQGDSNRSRSKQKRWVAVFACRTTTFLHAEMMQDNGTEEFYAALSRFLCLYPGPRKIKSDNGSQIKATYRAMSSFLAEKGIEWSFSLAGHPASNGSAEAAVKLIKRQVNILMRQKKVSDTVLRTCLRKAQSLVNTRPIGARGEDMVKITPFDFVDGALSRLPVEVQVNEDLPLESRAKYMEEVFGRLWAELQQSFFSERIEKRRKFQERQHLEVGDVVAVRELNAVRGNWSIGRVHEVHRSADDLVRSAKVERPDHKVILVGINRLALITKEEK